MGEVSKARDRLFMIVFTSVISVDGFSQRHNRKDLTDLAAGVPFLTSYLLLLLHILASKWFMMAFYGSGRSLFSDFIPGQMIPLWVI